MAKVLSTLTSGEEKTGTDAKLRLSITCGIYPKSEQVILANFNPSSKQRHRFQLSLVMLWKVWQKQNTLPNTLLNSEHFVISDALFSTMVSYFAR